MTKTTDHGTTVPLTSGQAHVLNDLARVSDDLRRKIQDVIDGATHQLERATAGHHLSGFPGDLFGQARYNADALAVERSVLIRTAHVAGSPLEAITIALVPEAERQRAYLGEAHFFVTDETFPIDPTLHEET